MLRSHGVQRPGMQMASNATRRLEQVARTLTTNAAAGATSRSRGSQLLKENLQRQVCHGPTRPTGEARTPRANPRGPTCPVCGPVLQLADIEKAGTFKVPRCALPARSIVGANPADQRDSNSPSAGPRSGSA